MQWRSRRICFRLTKSEEVKFLPLIRLTHALNWSELIRMALDQLAKRTIPTSDNGVRQPIGGQTEADEVSAWLTRFPVKPKKTRKPAKK
jgi:hypothetical protein